jgi:YHS domain-containing protein
MIFEDPVCGTQIEESEAIGQTSHLGNIYYLQLIKL